MHVTGNGAGKQFLLQSLFGYVEGEAAGAMTDVEAHAALHGGSDLRQNLSSVIENPLRAAMIRVRDNVALPQQRQDVLQRRVGSSDMRHQRKAYGIGGFPRQLQRL